MPKDFSSPHLGQGPQMPHEQKSERPSSHVSRAWDRPSVDVSASKNVSKYYRSQGRKVQSPRK